MSLPAERDDNYPYEKLTRKRTAEINRMRDRQMRKLRREHDELLEELHKAKRQLAAVREAGIDPDVLIATKEAFK
jgi:hypothetical protein